MVLKLLSQLRLSFLHFITILMLFLSSVSANAQCAGSDTILVVCGDDLPNPSNKSIDLNNLLGIHTSGGIWTDNLFSEGLNEATGILDAQKIKKSGVYTYSYTVDNGIGCKDSATITVTIGGFPGVGSIGNACKDDIAYNLFQVFDSRTLDPQNNGTWLDDDATGAILDNILNATTLEVDKTYHFTYRMSSVGSCSEKSTTVQVVIKEPANSGISTDLKLCSDQVQSYSNYNLFGSLRGEDPNGTWTEFDTNEISGLTDSTIDIQNIYNTKGPGKYSFTYTVLSKNRICPNKSSIVEIIIENKLNFTGATLDISSDICEDKIPTASYNAVLKQVNQLSQNIPDGSYDVTYTISGVMGFITSTSNFSNGILYFDINRSYFSEVGDFTVRITNIVNKSFLGICGNTIGSISDVLHVNPLPKINTATLTIPSVCKGSSAPVAISGNTNLTDGNYNIIYNLSGKNTAVAQPANFSVANGVVGNFDIPANLIPIDGNTTISITKITNSDGCTNSSNLSKDFVVKPLTNLPNFKIDIEDVCLNQNVTVKLSGLGTLTNITINYDLTGANPAINQSVTKPVSSGNTSFDIPASSFVNTGVSSLLITGIIDNGSGCVGPIPNSSKSFTIHNIPNTPTTKDEIFCKNDKKTIADLTPSGIQYQWFDTLTSTTILSSSSLLISGNYYVKEVNTGTKCESGKAMANVLINEVQAPILNKEEQNFCGLDNPILQNLTDRVTTIGSLTWFDAPINGNQLVPTTLLKEGITYYGFNFSNDTNCYSDALLVTVSLSNCNVTPGFFIPDGFSPNGDGVNDTFRIPDIEFIYPNFSLEIYSRYGNLMFTGNKNKPNWDGKSSDSNINIDGNAPNGIYFYVINFNKNNVSPKQGRLYLNR